MPKGRGPKFYAVQAGRQPGVYRDWPTAERQVRGYRGAIFKSFPSLDEALAFVRGEPYCEPAYHDDHPSEPGPTFAPDPASARPDGMSSSGRPLVVLYTDGSHTKGNARRRGIGAWCMYGGREYRMCQSLPSLALEASNPTLEVYAAVEVLRALDRALPAGVAASVRLMADYEGVIAYVNGVWRPKPEQTAFQAAVAELAAVLRAVRRRGVVVTACHVAGHSGDPGNDAADFLAKQGASGTSYSDMDELFRSLQ